MEEWRVHDESRKQKWRIPILHDDEAVIALNKPGGLPVIPERWHPEWPCLRSIAESQLGAKIWVVHRLDAGTSGVLIFAKTAEAHRHLCEQFGNRKVEKIYHALVQGKLETDALTIQRPIAPHPKKKGIMMIARAGKRSVTSLRVLERFRTATLLEVHPQTGRQHQIRVHLQAIGYPLLVDPVYGNNEAFYLSSLKSNYHRKEDEEETPLIQRLTLHAASLKLRHPVTEEELTIAAPEPKDFHAAVRNLRKYAG